MYIDARWLAELPQRAAEMLEGNSVTGGFPLGSVGSELQAGLPSLQAPEPGKEPK